MAKTEKNDTGKQNLWTKFIRWHASYSGQRVTGIIYSAGASVVIVGALFKLLHWPGASGMLIVGMFTEAFLFLIGTLDKPHQTYNWGNVFPQLLEFGTDPALLEAKAHQPRPTLLGAGVENGGSPIYGNGGFGGGVQPAHATAGIPSLNDKEMETLQNAIHGLAQTASQLSDLGKAASTTAQLSAQIEAAGSAAEKFAASQINLLAVSQRLGEAYQAVETNMQQTARTADGLTQEVESIGGKLNTLNAIYELQVNALQGQVALTKAHTATLSQVSDSLQALEESAEEAKQSQEAYTAAAKKLATQVADLNSIYGNMLNALA